MRAQVNNPANGWNDPENAASAESEPTGPGLIKGNFTHDDDAESAAARLRADRPDRHGERLQRLHRELSRVPARRPLPQGADRLGAALHGLPGHAARDARAPAARPVARAAARPGGRARAAAEGRGGHGRPTTSRAQAARRGGRRGLPVYEALLPDDARAARALEQPAGRRALRARPSSPGAAARTTPTTRRSWSSARSRRAGCPRRT